MAYNRYRGNTGRMIRVPDPEDLPPAFVSRPEGRPPETAPSAPALTPVPENREPPERRDAQARREPASAPRQEHQNPPEHRPPSQQPEGRERSRRPEHPEPRPRQERRREPKEAGETRPPGLLAGWGESIGGLLGKLKLQELESEDLLLLLILYFLYRESGDKELLLIMGAMYLL